MNAAPKISAFLLVLALSAGAQAAVPDLVPGNRSVLSGQPEEMVPREPRFQMAQDFVPLESVLAGLRKQYSGHQLSVSGPSPQSGGFVYRIKWLTEDGAVLYVVADAESGAVISVEGE